MLLFNFGEIVTHLKELDVLVFHVLWCFQEELLHVSLTKPDASVSFGFGITRDNSTSPSLLKVAQITSGGVADVDGRLIVGNRLLQVHLHYYALSHLL